MIRDDARRALLFDLDLATQEVRRSAPESPALLALTHCYHNLLRIFAEL
jgi:PKHD-type hydroxylase